MNDYFKLILATNWELPKNKTKIEPDLPIEVDDIADEPYLERIRIKLNHLT